jgi:hypothetical protein
MSLEALQLAHDEWEWNDRAKEIFTKIMAENPKSTK